MIASKTLPWWISAAVIAMVEVAAICPAQTSVASTVATTSAKPRVVVMTDIGGDPDDRQSIVRFLMYSCEFDVEGLCAGLGHGHRTKTRPDLIREAVEAYGKVEANLRKHHAGYPAADRLMGLIKEGYNDQMHATGPGKDSEASEWIIKVVDRDDPRPVWFTIWGGPRDLVQAIWKVQATRTPAQLATFKSKIRVYSVNDQDNSAVWIRENHPDITWIFARVHRGMFAKGDQNIVSLKWLENNVRTGHGALGATYPPKAVAGARVVENDTPSFLYLIPNGLSDPAHFEWGSWGGRFGRSGLGNQYRDRPDIDRGKPDPEYTVRRWRHAYQNDFEARMDWCVKPFNQANHAPKAVCNGDQTRRVLQIQADPGQVVKLSADGSTDPDGDQLTYRWWVYREAGTYTSPVTIDHAKHRTATLAIPPDASGQTLHVILEVVDAGDPALTAYRRVIITVRASPATKTANPNQKTDAETLR